MIHRKIGIRQCLSFYSLRSVYDQKRPFARRQASGYLIGKIHVTGGINEVQYIFLTIVGIVYQSCRLQLNGYASLTLKVHAVKYLILHFPLREHPGFFYQPVGQGRFAVIYMSYYAKIPDILLSFCYHIFSPYFRFLQNRILI